MKQLGAISVLADGKAGPHLPPHRELRSRCDGDTEASFAVDVSGDVRREELATARAKGRRLIAFIDFPAGAGWERDLTVTNLRRISRYGVNPSNFDVATSHGITHSLLRRP
jgi:hypothetical protein